MPRTAQLIGGAPCAVRALCEKLAVFHHCWLAACHGSQGPEFCTPQPLLVHQEFDHACFCRWVVFRDVPRINTVIIGAVRALCENAPYVATFDCRTPFLDM